MKKLLITSIMTSSMLLAGTIHNNMDDRISGYSYDGDKKDYEANSDGLGVVAFQHYSGVKSINNELKTQKVLRNVLTFSLNPSLPGFNLGKLENIKIGIENGIIGTIEDKDILDQLNDGNESSNNTENTIGASCDDNDNTTVNTVWQSDGITCAGGNIVGTTCDDNDTLTNDDIWLSNGICTGTLPGGNLVGSSCDDGNSTTVNTVWQSDGTTCAGGNIIGSTCDDNDVNTINDVWLSNGYCQGEISNITSPGTNPDAGFMDLNGVTIKCPNGNTGDTFYINGKTYLVVDDTMLRSIIDEYKVLYHAGGTVDNWKHRLSTGEYDLSTLCTTHITSTKELFKRMTISGQSFKKWDVSNVTNMSYMFNQTGGSYSGDDLAYWNVSKVTDMSGMFHSAYYFNSDISGWDVRNVMSMSSMFHTNAWFKYDLSGWDVRHNPIHGSIFENSNMTDSNKWPRWGMTPGEDKFEPVLNTGYLCDDGNVNTVNSIIQEDGTCSGGVLIGSTCDDNNPYEVNEKWLIDGTCGDSNKVGTSCDDNNSNTINDLWQFDSSCQGEISTDGLIDGTVLSQSFYQYIRTQIRDMLPGKTFELVYQSTTNGSATNWHTAVDDKGPTLTVIKSGGGILIAYSDVSWDGTITGSIDSGNENAFYIDGTRTSDTPVFKIPNNSSINSGFNHISAGVVLGKWGQSEIYVNSGLNSITHYPNITYTDKVVEGTQYHKVGSSPIYNYETFLVK